MGTSTFSLGGTSPATASTVASANTATGLDRFTSLHVYAEITGATGGSLNVYLQTSPDLGTTWVDYASFPLASAGASVATYSFTVSRGAQQSSMVAVGKNLSPLLAANSVIGGDFGDRMRAVFKANASTTAGAAQVITISGTSGHSN